ncbi:MAG: TerB N-terminal domain-containing protein, partial [Clostridiales bacterium]|nr:TerB N-terminal domain-containing protein [Clostridiales bacterium]
MKEKPKSALVLNGLEDETFAEYILTDEAGETSAEGAVALMRKLKSLELSVSANQCNSAEAVLFEKQGALLSEYEDSYLRAEPFISPNPTYQALSLNQMRTYASWRTGCKQGIYRDVPDAYVRLYVKEVISLIGMPDRDEAMIELSWLLERVPESKWELRKSIKDSVKLLYIFGDFSGTYFDVLKDSGLFEHFPW